MNLSILALTLPGYLAPPQTQPSLPSPSARPWTILVYGAADNNADGPILEFLDGVRKAIDDDPGIELLLFLDRSAKYSDDAKLLGENFTGGRLYRLRKDSAERLAGGEHFPAMELGKDVEVDSADAENLRRFIAWGKARDPARRTGVMIYSHASGESMCPDEESGRDMGIAEVSAELTERESVDFLALELCNMGGIEIGYEWRPEKGRFGADILLAIPNAGPPLAWERAFARIRSKGHASAASELFLDPATMTAADFGALVIEEGHRGRLEAKARGFAGEREAAACYDLRAASKVKQSVDELAVLLARTEMRDAVLELRGPGSSTPVMNYSGGGPFVDLFDLCHRIENYGFVDEDVRFAAKGVCANVDRFVLASFGMDGYSSFQPGKHGVFIVLPANKPGRWKLFQWYTPLKPKRERDYGRWSFLADGATQGNGVVENWFELLDSWLDEPGEAGGVNGYRW